MRSFLLVAVFAVGACSDKAPPPPKNEFEAFERKYVIQYQTLAMAMRKRGEPVDDKDVPKNYRAVYIGKPGVFIDRKLVATLSEIKSKRAELSAAIEANAKLLPTIGYTGLSVTFELDDEPAAVAIDALRLFIDRKTYFNTAYVDPEIPSKITHILCGSDWPLRGKTANEQEPGRDSVDLSVFLDKGRIWVGLSRINEFQEIPDAADGRDIEKLRTTLREHKASEFFTERSDIELAASDGTAGDVLKAFDSLCYAGFIDIAILEPDKLTARPEL